MTNTAKKAHLEKEASILRTTDLMQLPTGSDALMFVAFQNRGWSNMMIAIALCLPAHVTKCRKNAVHVTSIHVNHWLKCHTGFPWIRSVMYCLHHRRPRRPSWMDQEGCLPWNVQLSSCVGYFHGTWILMVRDCLPVCWDVKYRMFILPTCKISFMVLRWRICLTFVITGVIAATMPIPWNMP